MEEKMRRKTFLQETVYSPAGLPKPLINHAIYVVRNKPYRGFIVFTILEDDSIMLRLDVFGEGLLDENNLARAANDLRKELYETNKIYLLLKEVYGLEPKKPWWKRLWNYLIGEA